MKILSLLAAAGLLFGQLNPQPEECLPDPLMSIEKGNPLNLTRSKHKKKQKSKGSRLGHLYSYHHFDATSSLAPGSAFSFNAPPVRSGSISQTAPDTFTIRKSGHYHVHFIADALYPTNGLGVTLELNGVIIPPGTPNKFIDTPHILQQIVPITLSDQEKAATLRVIVTGSSGSLQFPAGPSVSITIIQLETSTK